MAIIFGCNAGVFDAVNGAVPGSVGCPQASGTAPVPKAAAIGRGLRTGPAHIDNRGALA